MLGIREVSNFKMYNAETNEVVLEGELSSKEAIEFMSNIKNYLMLLNLKLNDEFSVDVYITKENLDRLKEYGEKNKSK